MRRRRGGCRERERGRMGGRKEKGGEELIEKHEENFSFGFELVRP